MPIIQSINQNQQILTTTNCRNNTADAPLQRRFSTILPLSNYYYKKFLASSYTLSLYCSQEKYVWKIPYRLFKVNQKQTPLLVEYNNTSYLLSQLLIHPTHNSKK